MKSPMSQGESPWLNQTLRIFDGQISHVLLFNWPLVCLKNPIFSPIIKPAVQRFWLLKSILYCWKSKLLCVKPPISSHENLKKKHYEIHLQYIVGILETNVIICHHMSSSTGGNPLLQPLRSDLISAELGYPKSSSIYRWIFPYKPSSCWGTSMTLETSMT